MFYKLINIKMVFVSRILGYFLCAGVVFLGALNYVSHTVAQTSLRSEDYIEKRIQDLEEAVWQLKQRYNSIEENTAVPILKEVEAHESADLFVRIMQVEETLRRIIGENEKINHHIKTLKNSIDILSKDTEFRFAEVDTRFSSFASATVSQSKSGSLDPTTPKENQNVNNHAMQESVSEITNLLQSNENPSQMYEDSYVFITKKRFREAEIAMKKFIMTFPQHVLVSNATYWLGESYYARNDYRNAATQFLKVYTDYGNTKKAAHSMYKLSLSLFALNQKKQACSALNAVTIKYPHLEKTLEKDVMTLIKNRNC